MANSVITKKKKSSLDDIVNVTCYNKTEQMTRREALVFYFDCMMNSDGSERERYTNIYEQLMVGYTDCYDL